MIPSVLFGQAASNSNLQTAIPKFHRLTELESHLPSPFLMHGMTFDDPALQLSPRLGELYEQALTKYPDLTSCIQDDGFTGDEFNINAFVWEDFSYNQDFAVCTYWVADFLRDAQEVAAWFEAQGFHSVRTVRVSYAEIRHMGALSDGSSVSAGWLRREDEFPFGSNHIPSVASVWGQPFALSLEIIFSNEGRPLYVSYGFIVK